MNKKTFKGFTLAELLIVMAIILVLAAIFIPKFTGQTERSRETADISALRAAYSEAMSDYMLKPSNDGIQTVRDIKLISNGKLEYAKVDLPFDGAYDLMISNGEYSVSFDFNVDKPKVSITLQKQDE